MKVTYSTILAALASHPNARASEAASGLTSAQAAAMVMQTLGHQSTQAGRDAVLRSVLGHVGIYIKDEASFAKGADELVDRMNSDEALHREAERMSNDSRNSPQFVSPERIVTMARQMRQTALTQGLTGRMDRADTRRERYESPAAAPSRPELRREADDRRDLRSAVHAATWKHGSESGPFGGLRYAQQEIDSTGNAHIDRLRSQGGVGLRESLSQAFDLAEHWESAADPLEDESLIRASDLG